MGFEPLECNVCIREITIDGGIFIGDFARELLALKHKAERQGDPLSIYSNPFVNEVAYQYFLQFPSRFREQRNPDSELLQYRLEKVLADSPDEFLFFIAHNECLPHQVWEHHIPVRDIDSSEKIEYWYNSLKKKKWFSQEAWQNMMAENFNL